MAEKINIIVTPEAMAELEKAILKVKELQNFINQAGTPSGSANYTNQINSANTLLRTTTTQTLELIKQQDAQRNLNKLQQESATRINESSKASESMFSKMSNGLKNVIQLFGLYSAAMLAHKAFTSTLGIGTKLSDDLAQLAIYLDNSKKAADDVFESLTKLKTRTSLSDLLGLAQIVAKKGVVKAEIAGIVSELDKLFLVLGEGLGSKDVATASIIKLISIFNTDGEITGNRIKEVGSSLQYLTTSGVATGDYLIRFAERLGAVRSLTGQTMPHILGMGAAFEQLGVKAEVGANSTGQIIAKLFTDIPKYAKDAGLDVQEFKYLLETDSTSALINFAEGLKKTSKDSEMFSLKLKGAELQGVRVKSVLSEIAIQGDLFREKVKGASKATEDLAKNAESAALKQKTFAATIENIKKEYEVLISTTENQEMFSNIANGVYSLVKAVLSIPFSLIVSGLATWTAYKLLLNKAIIANNIQLTLNTVKEGAYAIANGFSTASLVAKTTALEAEILALNTAIASEIAAIATAEAEILVNTQNTASLGAEIIAREANIVVLRGQVAATEAVIVSNKAMTASLASTGWGALAIVIGLAVYAIWEMATATDAVKNSAEELLALTDKNAVLLKRKRDRESKEFDERIKDEEYKNRLLVGNKKKTSEQALKDNNDFTIKEAKLYEDAHKKSQKQKQIELDALQSQYNEQKRIREQAQEIERTVGGSVGTKMNLTSTEKEMLSLERKRKTKKQEIDLEISEQKRYQEILKEGYRIRNLKDAEVPDEEKKTGGSGKADKYRTKSLEDSLKLEYDLKMSNLERDKEIISDELKAEKDSLEYKLTLNDLYGLKEIQIAQAVYDEKIRLAKGNDALEKIALNEKNTAIENAYEKSLENQQKIKEDYLKNENEKTKEWYKNNPPFFIETPKQKEDREQAEKEKLESFKAQLQAFRTFAGDFADNLGIGDTFDLLLNPDKDGNTLFEKLKKDEATWKDYGLAITTIMQDAYNFINQQSQARFDAEYSRLEEQKNIGLKNAGDSASAKEKIELDYEKKKKEIQKREAKAKKQQSLMNIALDTAQAVMSVLSTGGGTRYADFGISAGLLSGMVIAMGAAQAAMVIAQKIPEYWTGTDNAKEGLALTQERGAEIITDRKGKIKTFGSHKGAVLTRMQSGDKVFNAEESKRMMFENEYRLKATTTNTNNGMTADEMEAVMVRTLGGRPTLNMNFDKGGFGSYISKNGNITRQSESRGSGRGIEV